MLKLFLVFFLLNGVEENIREIAKSPRPNEQVVRFLSEQLPNSSIQSFGDGKNIISGNGPIIICAHYDTVSRSPGADDNASGVTLVIELAKQLKGNKYTFVLFDQEEQGLIGSRYFVKNRKEPIDFVINADMIGHLNLVKSNPDDKLDGLFKKYPWAKGIVFRGHNEGTDSDSFKGIPVVFLHTGLTNTYHKSSDKPDTLDYEGIKLIIQFALELASDPTKIDYDDLFKREIAQ